MASNGCWPRSSAHNSSRALPKLDGVVGKLQTGAKVADIGCGAGVALIEMAKAYPRSHFHGYDIAKIPLARASENARQAGFKNITFHDASVDRLPSDASHDFITTFRLPARYDATGPCDAGDSQGD